MSCDLGHHKHVPNTGWLESEINHVLNNITVYVYIDFLPLMIVILVVAILSPHGQFLKNSYLDQKPIFNFVWPNKIIHGVQTSNKVAKHCKPYKYMQVPFRSYFKKPKATSRNQARRPLACLVLIKTMPAHGTRAQTTVCSRQLTPGCRYSNLFKFASLLLEFIITSLLLCC